MSGRAEARPRSAIVLSISSDIGTALAARWRRRGWAVTGTFRARSIGVDSLEAEGARLVPCDLVDRASVERAGAALEEIAPRWDVFVSAAGTLEPVGPFAECSFDDWEHGVEANVLGPLRLLRRLLARRRLDSAAPPTVVLFAGAGTNGPAPGYSCYSVSKIALVKATELLAAELTDTRFVVVGPGWVKTKIHDATLAADPARIGEHHARTVAKLASGDCTPMERVLDCIDWTIETSCAAVSGRNFSVVADAWGSPALEAQLSRDADMYKLRRSQNEWRP